MKSFISIACALFLLGCTNEPQNSATAQEATPAPLTVEENVTDTSTEPSAAPSQAATEIESTTAPAQPVATPAASVDGASLYAQKCASCHGSKAEKSALNKSQVIAGWDKVQTSEALKGYQAGTYGKEMKALMQGQAKALNDAQIDALAQHIAGL